MLAMKTKIRLIILAAFVLTLAGISPVLSKPGDEQILMQDIRRHISQNMLWPAENMRMEFLSGMPKLDHMAGKVTFSIESRPREEYIGDTSFTVRIFSNGIFVREENVRIRIEVLRDFLVSLNNTPKDSILAADDITVQKKWVKIIPLNSLSSPEEAVGKIITVNVRPNTQLTRNMLKDVMPVKKGKMVQVILDNGAMTMMMNGIAEEDGADDAVVKIRNIGSNKVIYARVIGPGKVQVDF
jgi:flagellar basal body P-ring formation protein FlgA